MGLHHGGEDEAVENDVVLSDKVYETCALVLPPGLPAAPAFGVSLAKVLGVADVSDGSVEPYVEYFALGTLNGNGDSPVEVARHGAGLEVHVEPRLALSVDVCTPLGVVFENPLSEPLLIVAQGEIPVFGRAFHQSVSGIVLVGGVDQFVGTECGTAFFALVAVCPLCMASRTFADDVAVGEELTRHLVAELFFGDFLKFPVVVKMAEEIGSKFVVCGAGGTAVDVEGDSETFEGVADDVVVSVDDLLGRDALLACPDGDGYAVLVRAADKHYGASLQAEVAHVDVGRHIDSGKMSDVNTAVGIGQGGGDKSAVVHVGRG